MVIFVLYLKIFLSKLRQSARLCSVAKTLLLKSDRGIAMSMAGALLLSFASLADAQTSLQVGAQASPLAKVKSWAFQLQNVDPTEVVQSRYDLIVVDHDDGKGESGAFPPEILEQMRHHPDGSRRLVLAYFSIGEAESYRYYWRDSWLMQRPEWLEPDENPQWPGNYPVRYWYPEWQSILFGNPQAYLDRIIAAGFDGVYLDGIDQFEQWQQERPSAQADMVDLVTRIASYARERRKGFLVVPQNGDELLENPQYVAAIDGVGREDLLYGELESEQRNDQDEIDDSIEHLRHVTRAGKAVLVVEYTKRPDLATAIMRELNGLGFIGYIADRELNTLTSPAVMCGSLGCSR